MSAQQRAATADTIRSLVQDFARTWNRLDPGPYLELYSEDMQFYRRGARSGRGEFEQQVRKVMAAYESYRIEPTDPQINVLGQDAAVASFRYTGTAVDTTASSRNLQAATTLVYERRGGGWKIVQAHESIAPPDPSE